MSLVWGINGYAQAVIWPPIIRIFAEMLEKEWKMKYCVDILSSQVVLTTGALAVCVWGRKRGYAAPEL